MKITIEASISLRTNMAAFFCFFFFVISKVVKTLLISWATPFAERKGLVTLQPLSCRQGRNLMWPIRCRSQLLSWSSNYVTCLVDVSILLSTSMSIIVFLSENSMVAAWPDGSQTLTLCERCGLRDYLAICACWLVRPSTIKFQFRVARPTQFLALLLFFFFRADTCRFSDGGVV